MSRFRMGTFRHVTTRDCDGLVAGMTMICYFLNSNNYYLKSEAFKVEKQDLASARRRLRSSNLKSRKRALKILHDYRRNLQKIN